MPHEVVNKVTQTIRGMKYEFKLTAPAAINVDSIIEKIEGLFSWAKKTSETDPNQFNLSLESEEDND